MSGSHNRMFQMLEAVAAALGDDLRGQVAFVGGCTTALLVTDEYSLERVRYTDDVDLVIHLAGYGNWPELVERLHSKGFMESPMEPVTCRMKLGELKVDVMPDKPILGFTNRWFAQGLAAAVMYVLPSGSEIRVFTAPYFLATKFEAYADRGKGDPLGSSDIEDILNIVDGREELVEEVNSAPDEVKKYLSQQITALLDDRDFQYAVQSTAQGSGEREELLMERLCAISRGKA